MDSVTDNGEGRVVGSINPVTSAEASTPALTIADVINANAIALHRLREDVHRMGLHVSRDAAILIGAEMPVVPSA